MIFKRSLFGYRSSDVDYYISRLEKNIIEKENQIANLESQIRSLKYDQEDLFIQIAVLKEINRNYSKADNG